MDSMASDGVGCRVLFHAAGLRGFTSDVLCSSDEVSRGVHNVQHWGEGGVDNFANSRFLTCPWSQISNPKS